MRPSRAGRPSMNIATPSRLGAKARSVIISSLITSPGRIATAGTGSRRSSPFAAWAKARTSSAAANPRTIRPILFNMDTPELPKTLRYRRCHLIRCLDDLGIHLIGPLSGNQLGDFLDGIDVRSLEIVLVDLAVTGITGRSDHRCAGGGSLLVEVAAQRLETRLIGEVGKVELTDLPRVYFRVELGEYLTRLVD